MNWIVGFCSEWISLAKLTYCHSGCWENDEMCSRTIWIESLFFCFLSSFFFLLSSSLSPPPALAPPPTLFVCTHILIVSSECNGQFRSLNSFKFGNHFALVLQREDEKRNDGDGKSSERRNVQSFKRVFTLTDNKSERALAEDYKVKVVENLIRSIKFLIK